MMKLNNQYWSNRYSTGNTGWDTGQITPPLQKYFDGLTNKNAAILIPGCGNSYEAAYLLQLGFTNITLIDISAVLCEKLQQNFAGNAAIKIICADFFEHSGQYDLIVEQTFFCALHPALRQAYARQMYRLLKPGGVIAGLLFNRQFEGGPPFGGSETEYRHLFSPLFNIRTLSPCYNSIPPRQGSELFVIFCKTTI
ncbi:MAG TPA: methyltransferase domain-containing protein [Ferruginibacter sp.]|nr:methyltransferase domain-containing protein [Ferruginibacter sp.]HMP21582.1 methyltransferase domain-containing protein [Ferruginibacter sp.]